MASTTLQKSDLPFGSEFSPSQVELPRLLELAHEHEGDQAALQAAIQAGYFSGHGGGSAKNQRTLAMNCRLGMRAYGLIDEAANLTELGRTLYGLRDDGTALYDKLAAHILLNLRGMALVRCIQEMTIAGERVTLDALRHALKERGTHFPGGGKHPSMMRLWLAKAGVLAGVWTKQGCARSLARIARIRRAGPVLDRAAGLFAGACQHRSNGAAAREY